MFNHLSFDTLPEKNKPKRYGCAGFFLDIFLTLITGGFWLIWIFVREMRG